MGYVQSQEIQARLTVLTSKISTQVNKNVFQTLQTSLTNFINNRKWTGDAFQPNEKIQCNFLLNIEQDLGNNMYRGKLPYRRHALFLVLPMILRSLISWMMILYSATRNFSLLNLMKTGYRVMILWRPICRPYWLIMSILFLGFDYGSFSLRGGDAYFKKAWNIVNNAPESRDITGWKSFENIRNRYWLAENLNNNRFALMHDALYAYYRSGMDIFYENEEEGRNGIISSLNSLNTLNTENPNSMIMQFFFQGKSAELVKVFSRANSDIKTRARDILTKIDITNTAAYKELR